LSYWAGAWPCEDGGPARRQLAPGALGVGAGERLEVTSRTDPVITMVVERERGELFLLRHTAGDDATSTVERIDPVTLETLASSPPLPGGPTWPGSLAVHANGSLYVVFGNHAHRLSPDLSLEASTTLPRRRPYNGFVVLGDGSVATKDFAGARPGHPVPADQRQACELVVLAEEDLAVLGARVLPEASIARLSAHGERIFVVGDTSLLSLSWDGRLGDLDLSARYRTEDGQGYGWDCVIAAGAAWFLDHGEGTEAFDGSMRGKGVASTPLHLVRVSLADHRVVATEVCGLPGGIIANPPLVDEERGVVVAYDSGNGAVTGFDLSSEGELEARWRRRQNHAGHLLLFQRSGELVTGDYDPQGGDQLVVLDIGTGEELARVQTGSPVQSVLFPAATEEALYLCTLTTVSRVARPR
jgi:hypothetical protein